MLRLSEAPVRHARRDTGDDSPGTGWRLWVIPLVIYALTRLLDALLLVILGHDQVAQEIDGGRFVGEAVPRDPGYLALLTNWDGQWYQEVAEHGYPDQLPRVDGEVQQNAWAFYPLFPGVVRVVMAVSQLPFALAATLVSTLAGATAVVLLFRMVHRSGGPFNATTTVLALCLFPTAPVLQAAYTESLALLLLVLALGALAQRRYGAVAVAGVLLALTRPIVLPLALAVVVHGMMRWRRRHDEPFPPRERRRCVGAALVTGGSFAIWPVVPGLVTGEPRAYFETYGAWVDANAAQWRTWLGHLVTLDGLAVGAFGLAALGLLVWVVTRPAAAAWGTELRVWSVCYALYLLASTVPGTSVLRHTMFAIVPWWPAPQDPHAPSSLRRRVVILTAITLFGLSLQLFWLNRFFVIHADTVGVP